MTTFGKRVAKLREEKKLSQEELGKIAGIGQSTIAQIEKDRNKSTRKVIELAEALDTTPNYLINGVVDLSMAPASSEIGSYTEKDVDNLDIGAYVEIPYYDISLSAGIGNATWIVRDNPERLLFRESWLQSRRLNEATLKAMYVRGESMEPLLYHMDTVLIDISDVDVADGCVYAIIFKGKLYTKKLRNTEAGINIISYHPDYEPMHVTQETYDQFQILGKMVWRCG
ncbi:HTH-type transcriptional regulator prtR [Snodgrassella communis]|uniref:XRE family transcriptional regulator n=1 Tax=Snodgrassella communis TaxID=2946699 RepID=UPI000461F900|nr:S24 family peptidase [Snodgrassella communis]KDN12732.1 HTH-type transcriptional regulator prtR [Snodgrassella communis]